MSETPQEIEARVRKEIIDKLAHDLQSPLAALDMALKMSPEIPEDRMALMRTSLKRLREIAKAFQTKND